MPFGGIIAKHHFRLKSKASVPGLEWEVIGAEQPSEGDRIFNRGLSTALYGGRRQFTIQELADFGVSKLSFSNYVKAGDKFLGQDEIYFKPVQVTCGTGPPDPPLDLSDTSIIFLEGCVPEDNDFWQQSYGLMCAPGSFSLAPRELASLVPPLLPRNFSHPDIPWDEIHDHTGAFSDEPLAPADLRASYSPCRLCPPGYYTDRPGASGCLPCTGSDVAPSAGSVRCYPLHEYGDSPTIPPMSCSRMFEGCRIGSSCWTCLSLCCDACSEFYRRSDEASKAPTDCPIDERWLSSDLPPTKFEVPPDLPNATALLETRPSTTPLASTTTSAAVEETAAPTTALVTTTPAPQQTCGNSVRVTASSQCTSPSFGGILVCDDATLSREIAEGTLRLGSDTSAARYHVLEECDDGNAMSGDGCSGDCVVEDGFVCVPSLRLEKGDYCRTSPMAGLFERMAAEAVLVGWAAVGTLGDAGGQAGWMKLTPMALSGQVASRFGAIFRLGGDRMPRTPQHELFSCGCASDFTMLTDDAGFLQGLQGLVSHDAFSCEFRCGG